jgi:hypothetical protein
MVEHGVLDRANRGTCHGAAMPADHHEVRAH